MNNHSLEGIRVVDLTRVLTGPYCTMMLGDMGAEVIKIEQPGKGDDTRAWGPPFIGDESAYFLNINRNKRSITLNLKSPAAREVVWQLIDQADVVVENYSPGTAERLGFGYEAVKARRPTIVYCSISGFGQAGPSRDRTAYDLILQGMSGLMSVTGFADGEPTKFGIPIADIAGGMFAAYAVACALLHRSQTGEGQYIDTSMLGGQLALLTYQAGIYFATQQAPQRTGNAHAIVAPYQTFRTQDGYINIAAGNDGIYHRLCATMGLQELAADPRFKTNADRISRRDELSALIETALVQFSTAELVERLDAASVPCGPIYSIPQVFADPQVAHYNLHQQAPHATLGSVDQVGFPYLLSKTPAEIRRGPPTLGQHTAEVLAELGYHADQINELRAGGAL
ncbi:MAG: CaiB/BaiF CoA-transferase family protein [Herpetosiphon sp.]